MLVQTEAPAGYTHSQAYELGKVKHRDIQTPAGRFGYLRLMAIQIEVTQWAGNDDRISANLIGLFQYVTNQLQAYAGLG
jgi:hypothetical protein